MGTPAEQLSTLYTPEQLRFCTRLPKVELHAHLNGSIPPGILRELADAKGVPKQQYDLIDKGKKTLSECFKVFDLIHQITTDHDTITGITEQVLQAFALDMVVYLELRTTPKHRPEHGMTKRSYVEAVLLGLERYHARAHECQAGHQLVANLLLSIDRREGTAAAMETVKLAHDLASQGVVGIDLSGNPAVGQWATWEPALQEARALGLKISLHAGEVPNEEEVAAMFSFHPERVGHVCCLTPALRAQLSAAQIPIELCLSSNVITQSVPGYSEHHFRGFYLEGACPVALCTDDCGVFETSLSREFAIAAGSFHLDNAELYALARRALNLSFASSSQQEQVTRAFAEFERREQGG